MFRIEDFNEKAKKLHLDLEIGFTIHPDKVEVFISDANGKVMQVWERIEEEDRKLSVVDDVDVWAMPLRRAWESFLFSSIEGNIEGIIERTLRNEK